MSIEQILFLLVFLVPAVVQAVKQARAEAEAKRQAAGDAVPEPPPAPRTVPFEPAQVFRPIPEYRPPLPSPPIPSPPQPSRPLLSPPQPSLPRPAPSPLQVSLAPPPRATRAALLQAELRNAARQRHAIVLAAVLGPPASRQDRF